MNVAEGARRMQQAGRWMVLIPLGASLLFVGSFLVLAYLPAGAEVHGFGVLGIVPLLMSIEIPGAALWLAGWIVEGFAQKDQ
jgi:hypothetical protein